MKKTPKQTDIFAGKKLRELRTLKGMSQMELAAGIGLSFQQIQKYESGANRLSVSRMVDLANVLRVHPSEFFGNDLDADELSNRDALELFRSYTQLKNPAVKVAVRNLVRELSRG